MNYPEYVVCSLHLASRWQKKRGEIFIAKMEIFLIWKGDGRRERETSITKINIFVFTLKKERR